MKQVESKLTILVVDDDENIRMVLEKSLLKKGYKVSTADNAKLALNMLNRMLFHVVITDIKMEEMTGIELLEEIKELNNLMQVFIMTAHSELPVILKCMKAGAYDYFEKPLKIEDVLTSVEEAERRVGRWSELYKKYSPL